MADKKTDNSKARDKARLGRLAQQLERHRPFLRASLVQTHKPCIHKTSCNACRSGKKHPFCYLTIKTRGVTKNRYLPKRFIPKAKLWIKNYRKSRGITEEMSLLWLNELYEEDPPAAPRS
jgi:hypothetical protein